MSLCSSSIQGRFLKQMLRVTMVPIQIFSPLSSWNLVKASWRRAQEANNTISKLKENLTLCKDSKSQLESGNSKLSNVKEQLHFFF